jgi:hypothetical protein
MVKIGEWRNVARISFLVFRMGQRDVRAKDNT